MSDNDEIILGFCPLPGVHEDDRENITENNSEHNGAMSSSSPIAGSESELISGDVEGYEGIQDEQEPEEFKSDIQDQTDAVDYKPILEHTEDTVDYKHIAQDEQKAPEIKTEESVDLLNANFEGDDESEHVTVSSSIVDFINQAGAELTADTTLDDEDESERPAKKKRKTLPRGTFQCAECRTLCEDFNDYSSHMSTHSDVPLYTCPKCLYIFQDVSLYEAHIAQTCKAAGNSKDKECAVCRKNFKYDSHLREHIICMHNKSPLFSCPICAQNITSWRRSIDRHMANHVNNNKCPGCGVKGDSSEALDAHLLESGENHLHCKTCDYESSFRVDFFNHVNVHIRRWMSWNLWFALNVVIDFRGQQNLTIMSGFFCKFRDIDAEKVESFKSSDPLPPTIQVSASEIVNNIPEQSAPMLQIANDPSKQIITLPDGVNNNAFIPITLSTGNDELGQTVILIPQFLLMPNAGVVSQDGTQSEIIGTGQNDQVIYLECMKPEQSGMMPLFEVPVDKSAQDNVYNNHLSHTVVQAVQSLQGIQTVQPLQAVQTMQAMQPVQTVQQVQQVHQIPQVQPVQQIQQIQPVIQQVQSAQQIQQVQPVQQIQQAQQIQQIQQLQSAQVQALQTLQPVEPVQGIHSLQTMHVSEQVSVETIKQELDEENVMVDVKPPTSIESTSAPPISVQNAFSMALSPTTSGAPIDSANQQTGGPPALVCSVCHEVLRDSETYESHVKQHDKAKTKPKPNVVLPRKTSSAFKCDQCGQGFAAKHHLEQHTITFHSDVAGIVCPVCRVGMASEKTSLNEHLAKAHKLRVEPSGKLTECTGS